MKSMPRKSKLKLTEPYQQLPLDFETVIRSGRVLSREQVAARSHQYEGFQDYDPVAQTAEYMQRSVQFEEAWETTIQKAREDLLTIDARQLYLDFLTDLARQIDQGSAKSARLAQLLTNVASLSQSSNHVIVY